MWFIADLLERYTSSVAKTFLRFAAPDASPPREDAAAAPKHEHDSPRAEPAPAAPMAVAEATPAAVEPAAAEEAGAIIVPMGVRGEVVSLYVAEFGACGSPADGVGLVEKLRKDKKVRVPELQVIAAEVLQEAPTPRKKAEYLDALRAHVGAAEVAATA
ncbi:hypothetical protein [Acuticoccus mangrovi]|uniref:Uncharacterized protein n=1 Tax=Acuticoccus mangrovi TaxID=2796142 RepID=A0A934IMI5_9HYPH|nr:hypothetical protein [Acuticoccus mangrovi]MBJ3777646.1 hypothetical protein [Acuticoccus mangrovi]